ncbi:TetR/AcrR family transcriptional regulator [Tatumella morbirosei]|uniref:TetR/AcrR family transcriptional regulator n=1 Tax=Tatumella morbirosei TaxID=642227 RepID=UPI000699A074|nr:TetR/AcrR family transcriptional regulator [Tatumella morbirosei]
MMTNEKVNRSSVTRPGGRAARIQAAVYAAVEYLQQHKGSTGLSVHNIAEQAGVNPTTIYRRWGSLNQLLSDVSLQKLLPDSEPEDTGSLHQDFSRWLEEYVDELATETGRKLLSDIVAAPDDEYRVRCQNRHFSQIDAIRHRAIQRGETPPQTMQVMDELIAPLVYRIMFSDTLPDFSLASALLDKLLKSER